MTIRGPAGHLTNEIAVLPIPHNAVEGEFDRASLRLGREILQWVNNSAKDVWDEDKALRRLGQSVLDGRSKRDQ